MIHYHGLPITPAVACVEAIKRGHAFVSFRRCEQINLAVELCQSFALDNGAFSAWRADEAVTDWSAYYGWVDEMRFYPGFDFAVIPDCIDGSEKDNDELLSAWPWKQSATGAPVWHLHESLERLKRLASRYPRICLGSSGSYSMPGSRDWWKRMAEAMQVVCPEGLPITKLHGLRMLDPKLVAAFPFSSADSTNIARNIGIDARWTGSYPPMTKDARASLLRHRIESYNSPVRWIPGAEQMEFSLTCE